MIPALTILCLILVPVGVAPQTFCTYQSEGDGGYKASWTYSAAANLVQFSVEAKQRLSDNFWTGIGFGKNMRNGDMIIIAIVGGKLIASDRHSDGYSEPLPDAQQDIQHFSGRVENGMIYANFSRLINTGDGSDKPLEDPVAGNCQHFVFPTIGGPVAGDSSRYTIEQHINIPKVRLICNISRCQVNAPPPREDVPGASRSPDSAANSGQQPGTQATATEAVWSSINNPGGNELGFSRDNTEKFAQRQAVNLNPLPLSQQSQNQGQDQPRSQNSTTSPPQPHQSTGTSNGQSPLTETQVQVQVQDGPQPRISTTVGNQSNQQPERLESGRANANANNVDQQPSHANLRPTDGSFGGNAQSQQLGQQTGSTADSPASNTPVATPQRLADGNAIGQNQQTGLGANNVSGPRNSGSSANLGPGANDTPPVCEYSEGRYKAQWTYDDITQRLTINLSAPLLQGRWTGIGFGPQMKNGDMIIIQDSRGRLQVTDRHGRGHEEPLIDAHQDVEAFKGTADGGYLKASFNRILNTLDSDDVVIDDPSLDNCQYFMFPISGGNQNEHGRIQVHETVPKSKLICNVKRCKRATPTLGISNDAQSTTSAKTNQQESQASTNQVQSGHTIQVQIRTEANQVQGTGQPHQQTAAVQTQGNSGTQREQQNNTGQAEGDSSVSQNQSGNTQSIGQDQDQKAAGFAPNNQGQQLQGNQGPQGQRSQSGQAEQGQQQSTTQTPSAQSGRADGRSRERISHPCPGNEDHDACKTYVDDYMNIVYSRFPKTEAITQKACAQLAKHQDGIVLKECCRYMQFECAEVMNKFLPPIPNVATSSNNPAPAETSAATSSSPKPTSNSSVPGLNQASPDQSTSRNQAAGDNANRNDNRPPTSGSNIASQASNNGQSAGADRRDGQLQTGSGQEQNPGGNQTAKLSLQNPKADQGQVQDPDSNRNKGQAPDAVQAQQQAEGASQIRGQSQAQSQTASQNQGQAEAPNKPPSSNHDQNAKQNQNQNASPNPNELRTPNSGQVNSDQVIQQLQSSPGQSVPQSQNQNANTGQNQNQPNDPNRSQQPNPSASLGQPQGATQNPSPNSNSNPSQGQSFSPVSIPSQVPSNPVGTNPNPPQGSSLEINQFQNLNIAQQNQALSVPLSQSQPPSQTHLPQGQGQNLPPGSSPPSPNRTPEIDSATKRDQAAQSGADSGNQANQAQRSNADPDEATLTIGTGSSPLEPAAAGRSPNASARSDAQKIS